MAPDFALHGWDGSWHVERALWLENLFQSINIAEYRHSEIVPHIYGDVAAITSKYYWRGACGRNEKKPFTSTVTWSMCGGAPMDVGK